MSQKINIVHATDIIIREMRIEDIPAVFELGETLFTADKSPNLYRSWDEYEILERFMGDGDYCIVAVMDERIVGFVLGSVIVKRRSAWKYGYVHWIGVDENLKRTKIGHNLLEYVTELFIEAGTRIMFIDTAADNKAALRFFKKHGFGKETEHVFLSRNLTKSESYLKKKKREEEEMEE